MDIQQVFYILRKEDFITRKKILKLIDEEYLDYLLEENILKEDNDNYVVDDIEKLFYFGRYFIKEKDYQAANNIFDCCYKIDPEDFLVNYQLFYRALFNERREQIFKHFSVVYSYLKESERYSDANFYLLLVGYLYGIPEKYHDLATDFDNLSEEDILIDYSNPNFDMDENDMRKYFYEKNFYKANQYIDSLYTGHKLSFEEELEKELLIKMMARIRKINSIIDMYLKDNNIIELYNILEKESKKKNFQTSTLYIYKVISKYIEIKNTNTLPIITNNNATDTLEAIDANDFKKALRLLEKYNEEKNIHKKSGLYIMLENINELINELKKNGVVEEIKEEKLSIKDKKMIDEKIKQLRNGRVAVLLEPMDKIKRDLIHEYIRNYSDIVSFNIGENEERRIVMRYSPVIEEYININKTIEEIEYYIYTKHDYKEAFKRFQNLLRIGKPKAKTYGDCGLTLLKLHRTDEALDCLKIATIMAKEKGLKIDYTNIIEGIMNNETKEDAKNKVEISEEEFTDNNYVSLESSFISDIIGLMSEGEITLEDACTKLNLTKEQINYVKLLCARDYYYLNDLKKGDQLLNEVMKSKDKTKEIKKLIQELMNSKKYYHNRLDNEKSQLVFKKKK